ALTHHCDALAVGSSALFPSDIYSARIAQLRSTETAKRNPYAAKTIGFCLRADIDQQCLEGMLCLIATTCESAKMTLQLHSRTPSLLQDSASLSAFSV